MSFNTLKQSISIPNSYSFTYSPEINPKSTTGDIANSQRRLWEDLLVNTRGKGARLLDC